MSNINLPSRKLAGRYRVLGRGLSAGPSTLFEAESLSNQQRVAFKWLRLYAGHPALELDFSSTLRAVCELRHPSVARVYDAELEGHALFVVSEMLRGEALSASLAPGRVARAELCRRLLEVMHAVRHAHGRELVHGALHPENIFLVANVHGQARSVVTDFVTGQIAALARAPEKLALRRAAYRDPEQLRGRGELDARADVYALGVMTYQALTGRLPPVVARSVALPGAHSGRESTIAALERLPRRLTMALEAALADHRVDRPDSLDELSGALSELTHHDATEAPRRATTALWIMPRFDGSAVQTQRIVRVAAPAESAGKCPLSAHSPPSETGAESLGAKQTASADIEPPGRWQKRRGMLALVGAPLLLASVWVSLGSEGGAEVSLAERRGHKEGAPIPVDALRESSDPQEIRDERPLRTPDDFGLQMQPGSPERATTKEVTRAGLMERESPRGERQRPSRAPRKGVPSHQRDAVLPVFRAGEPPAVDEF